MRRIAFLIASVLVSAVFLWLALKDVPLSDVIQRISQANVLWLGLCLICGVVSMATRAIRWRGLLAFKVPPAPAFHIVNIMFILNQIPLRAGEVARSLLATRYDVPFMTAATSVIVERLLDTLMVVLMLSVGLSLAPSASEFASRSVALFGIASVLGFLVLVFFARYPNVAHRLLALAQRIIPPLKRLPLERLLDNVLEGLQPLTHWRSLGHAAVWTLASWGASLMTFYCVHRALNIEGVNLWLSAALTLSLASFSIALPVSVGSVGPFEAAVLVAGQALNMPETLAISLGFLLHGMNIFSYALWGVVGMLSMGVSLGDVMKPAATPVAPVSEEA